MKRVLLTLFSLFLLTALAVPSPAAEEDVSSYLKQGQGALTHQNFKEALKAFEKVLKLQPENPEGLMGMGISYLGLKEYQKSETVFMELLPKVEKPWQAEIYSYLGDINLQQNKHKEAIQNYDKVLEISPNHQRALFNRGYVYFYLKEDVKAFNDLNALLLLTPYDRAYYLRGELYRAKGEMENAEKDFSSAIELNPYLLEPYFQLVILWDEKRQYDREAQLLEQAIRNLGDRPELHFYLGRAYALLFLQMTQSYESAQRAFRTAPSLKKAYDDADISVSGEDLPSLALFHYEKSKAFVGYQKEIALSSAMLLQDLGRYKEAEKIYREGLDKEPKEKAWYMGLARNYTLQNKMTEAAKLYEKLLELQPDAMIMDSLAAIYYYGGEYKKSLEYSQKAIELNPKISNFYYNIAFTYKKLKMEKEAKANFDKVMELEPKSALAKIGQAEEAVKKGQWKRAESLASEAQMLDPSLADAFYYKGLALMGQRRYLAAQLQMEEAIRIESRDPEYYYRLGMIFINQDKRNSAERAFTEAALLNPVFFKTLE